MSSSHNDRTSEFFALAQTLPPPTRSTATTGTSSSTTPPGQKTIQQQKQQPPKNKKPTDNTAFTELRNFHQQAAGISKDIASTSALLKELTHAVQHNRGHLFSDDTQTVNHLVTRIKSSIENLHARLETADKTLQVQKRQLNTQAGQEASNLVTGLQTEFAEAASDFKKVLQQRTENLKETEDLQRKVYHNDYAGDADPDEPIPDMSLRNTNTMATAPPPVFGGGSNNGFPGLDLTSGLMMSPGEPTGSGIGALPRPHGIDTTTSGSGIRQPPHPRSHQLGSSAYSGHYSNISSGNSAPLTPLDIQRMEQEQQQDGAGGPGGQQQTQLIPDQEYLQARADAMTTVETQIVELGTIFNRLASLVHEHKEMVTRVEDNVDEANTNIFQSLGVLTDTLENLRTNRALAFKVFSILVIFIIFFIVFFA